MKTKSFKEVFGQYVELSLVPNSCLDSEVKSIEADLGRMAVAIRLALSVYVDFCTIQTLKNHIGGAAGFGCN